LCQSPGHENIVSVLRHGYLQNESYFFFDMELCQLNLDTYIKRDWTPTILQKMQYLTISMPPRTRIRHVMLIMTQIVNGVSYIHAHKEIHRDLKPSNSTSYPK
jgi:serine/threonine protein kinase